MVHQPLQDTSHYSKEYFNTSNTSFSNLMIQVLKNVIGAF